MPKKPLVSAIMPACNAEEFIASSVESVLSQTYENLELIVVDDGSSDRTFEILTRIAENDSRVILIRQKNQGVAAARNKAIEHSRGEYLAPIDADDLWSKTKIEKQVEVALGGSGRTGMVYTWWAKVDEDDFVDGYAGRWKLDGSVVDALLFVNFVGNASVPLYDTAIVRELGGYNERFRELEGQGCEDWDLSLRVARVSEIGVVEEYLVGYRDTTITGSMSSNTVEMAMSYELMLSDLLSQHRLLSQRVIGWSRGHFYTYLAQKAYSAGDFETAQRWLATTFDSDSLVLMSSWRIWLSLKIKLRRAVLPLTSIIWPDQSAWRSFRKRFRLRHYLTKRLKFVELAEMPSGFKQPRKNCGYNWRWWKPYDYAMIRRWRILTDPKLGEVSGAVPVPNQPGEDHASVRN